MSEFYDQWDMKKSKRNHSDFQSNALEAKNQSEISSERKYMKAKANSIKINRSKLPPDFFPRNDSLKRKTSLTKPLNQNDNLYLRQGGRKVESQRMHISPEKTSFFGFFEENSSKGKNYANTINLKRKFDSRQDPKRDKFVFQKRNFTPITGTQRIDILDIFPAKYDSQLKQAIISSGRIKGLKLSQKKQQGYKTKRQQESLVHSSNPKQEGFHKNNTIKETQVENQQIYNITFFNAKSTSFPPINKGTGPN